MEKLYVDKMGRIYLPRKIMNLLKWKYGSDLFFQIDEENGTILFEKAEKCCALCGKSEEVMLLSSGAYLCCHCIKDITKEFSPCTP